MQRRNADLDCNGAIEQKDFDAAVWLILELSGGPGTPDWDDDGLLDGCDPDTDDDGFFDVEDCNPENMDATWEESQDCDDGFDCTIDTCVPAEAPGYPNRATCVHTSTCNDGDPCTEDTRTITGCESSPVADGEPCFAPCLELDEPGGIISTCMGGVCQGTAIEDGLACDPNDACIMPLPAWTGSALAPRCPAMTGTRAPKTAARTACASTTRSPR